MGAGLSCRRVEFSSLPASDRQIVCFLPWLFSYARSIDAGLIPAGCLLAYEMPHAIVSPSPDKSIEALQVVVRDFREFMDRRQLHPASLTLVGLSIGNFAATYIANQIGARLYSVASGDRGEELVWNSVLAKGIRAQAEARGLSYADFKTALHAFNPINNLDNLGDGSIFISGRFDRVVPYRCASTIAVTARTRNHTMRRIVLPFGHSGTLFTGIRGLHFFMRRHEVSGMLPANRAGAERGSTAWLPNP